jgi:protein-S-isoprenylcysteine O-methyltransferase Ste14
MKMLTYPGNAEGVAVLPRIGVARDGATRRLFDPIELCAKALIVTLFTAFALRIGSDWLATGRLTGLLLLASESLVVVLTVFRRSAGVVDRSTLARVLTTVSMIGPPLVKPSLIAPLLPGPATVAISAIGLLIVITGKLTLGRSFGLLPANRGVVSSGIYRYLRHPIYLGYLIAHVAFVAANPIAWNFVTLLISDGALLRRAVCEEHTLAGDDAYREYMTRVKWRVMPGLF